MLELNKIHNMDCIDGMKMLDDNSVDLVVTSPPYDNLREYNGYSFDFEATAQQLFRVVKDGGVVVWVVGDATINGSETGTSFKQAIFFKEIGFNLHDTMIWNKGGFSAVGSLATRYAPVFEYMFVFTKGKIANFNPIKDRENKNAGCTLAGTIRNSDGSTKRMSTEGNVLEKYGQRFNIWNIFPQRQSGDNKHPAPFPEEIAGDHIISWSNVGDLVLDPFMGSGTTAKMASTLDRKFIGFEISKEYCDMANNRIDMIVRQQRIQC